MNAAPPTRHAVKGAGVGKPGLRDRMARLFAARPSSAALCGGRRLQGRVRGDPSDQAFDMHPRHLFALAALSAAGLAFAETGGAYQSTFRDYRPHSDAAPADWRALNAALNAPLGAPSGAPVRRAMDHEAMQRMHKGMDRASMQPMHEKHLQGGGRGGQRAPATPGKKP